MWFLNIKQWRQLKFLKVGKDNLVFRSENEWEDEEDYESMTLSCQVTKSKEVEKYLKSSFSSD